MAKTEDSENLVSRRYFICGVTATMVSASVLGSRTGAQQPKAPEKRALDDPKITHGKVEFKSGPEVIDGYLARPKKRGRYPAVIVIPGSWIVEPYIAETTAMLAQAGYIGLAVNVFHFFPKVANYDETDKIPWQTTQQLVRDHYRDERITQDVRAGIRYLKTRSFVRRGLVGITGFCGGGSSALITATHLKEIAAVVPFYAPVTLKLPNRTTPMEVASQIKVPVQGHYGTKDRGIGLDDVRRFEEKLRAQGTPIEIFTYDAGHGFFAYNRDESYQPEAAKPAWSRALKFLSRHLG